MLSSYTSTNEVIFHFITFPCSECKSKIISCNNHITDAYPEPIKSKVANISKDLISDIFKLIASAILYQRYTAVT